MTSHTNCPRYPFDSWQTSDLSEATSETAHETTHADAADTEASHIGMPVASSFYMTLPASYLPDAYLPDAYLKSPHHSTDIFTYPAANTHRFEPWQINIATWGNPITGFELLTGMLSLLLTFLGFRLYQLSCLIHQLEQKLKLISSADSLTGLANRNQLTQVANKLLATPSNVEVSLLYVNLDQFKAINNELGYSAGDELLCAISQRLQTCTQPHHNHMLARIGIDEFAMLIKGASEACVGKIAEGLLTTLGCPFYIQGQRITVSASLGLVHSNVSRVNSFEQLLMQANIAMSRAKIAKSLSKNWADSWADSWAENATENMTDHLAESLKPRGCDRQVMPLENRNRRVVYAGSTSSQYVVFHPSMQTEVRSQMQLKRSLSRAFTRKELRIHYQPIVNLQSSHTIGFEGLVRWQHPQRGLLFPGHFLPLATEMGLISAIDRWMMRAACQQLLVWQRQNSAMRPTINVNIASTHLNEPDLIDYLQQLLRHYRVAPEQLNLEVTESVMIADPDKAIDTLNQIKGLGLSVSLDDFGTGYSSLSYLHQLPVDVIKIDRSFISGLMAENSSKTTDDGSKQPEQRSAKQSAQQQTPPQHEVILKAIIDLAQALNIRVVAEGIERCEQLYQLKRMRCRYGQGYLFSKSISAPSEHLRSQL